LLAVPRAVAEQSELEQLRARVAELERELADRTERANAAVAAAEERLYWIDRWRIDFDALMRHRAAQWAFAVYENARRVAGKIRRRLAR
jgi:hypothetical protein